MSENYLALARLSHWYFSMLPNLRSGLEYKDLVRPYTTWSVKEIRDWLRVRGFPSNGIKVDLMEKLQYLFLLEEVPQILPPFRRKYTGCYDIDACHGGCDRECDAKKHHKRSHSMNPLLYKTIPI